MNKKTYMFIGAHPDDADIHFGGTTILLKELGHDVVFVSITDGSAGHHQMERKTLANQRNKETQQVAAFLGIRYIVMDAVDSELVADLTTRHKLIRLIREIRPDVIIAPRTNDYHPDHRAAGQLVIDSSFLLTVPHVCPEVPRLKQKPYIFHNADIFTKPAAFNPEIVTDITRVIDKKMESLGHHESQVFEWLPFVYPITEPIPTDKTERIEFLKRNWGNRGGALQFLPILNDVNAQYAEALERGEYGARITREIAKELFPFAVVTFS
jgi:LmbE family N-acetylglucosaminyl deacetylase